MYIQIIQHPAIQYPVSVNPLLPVSITISASANPFCVGNPVTFTATPTNGGTTPSYQWKVNGVNAGTDSPNYTYNPANGDLVSCVLTSSIACPITNPITSNTLSMTINNSLTSRSQHSSIQQPFLPGIIRHFHCNTCKWRISACIPMESQWNQCRNKFFNLFL